MVYLDTGIEILKYLEEWKTCHLLCCYPQIFLKKIKLGNLQIVQSCVLQGRFVCKISELSKACYSLKGEWATCLPGSVFLFVVEHILPYSPTCIGPLSFFCASTSWSLNSPSESPSVLTIYTCVPHPQALSALHVYWALPFSFLSQIHPVWLFCPLPVLTPSCPFRSTDN